MMKLGLVALTLATLEMTTSFVAGDDLRGNVLVLAEKTKELSTVNVGGLVAVMIPDSDTRPPGNIVVFYGMPFSKLGVVHCSQDAEGQTNSGAGHTIHLFRPVGVGQTQIDVSYTLNDKAETKVRKKYRILIKGGID